MLKRTIVLLCVLSVTALSPLAWGELQPTPGQLLIINDLSPLPGGGCVGDVHLIYGFLPEQSVRAFSFEKAAGCSIDVTKAAIDQVFHPIGAVTVRADLRTQYESIQTHRLTQTFRYSVLHCSLDPIQVEGGNVNDVANWDEAYGAWAQAPCEGRAAGEWDRQIVGSWLWIRSDVYALSGGAECDFVWNTPAEQAAHPSGTCIPGTPDGSIEINEPPVHLTNVPPGATKIEDVGAD